MTQSGRERKSIIDDGLNVLRAAIIFDRAAIIAATPTAGLS